MVFLMPFYHSMSSTDNDHAVGTGHSSWSTGSPPRRYIGSNADSLYTEAGGERQLFVVWAPWQAGRWEPQQPGEAESKPPAASSCLWHCFCPEENMFKSSPHLACPFSWYSSTAWHATCYCRAVHETTRITVKWAPKLQAFKTDREKAKEMKCCSTSTSIWCQVS